MKVSEEFVVGKHGIGWVGSDFKKYFEDKVFEARATPTFQKLPRTMNDVAIESEMKPGICEIGDVLAFMDAAPQECKDGNWNLFYFSECVVRVRWHGDAWSVSAWRRGGGGWGADSRVFSPATGHFAPGMHCCSCALALRLSELEEWKKKVEKVLNV